MMTRWQVIARVRSLFERKDPIFNLATYLKRAPHESARLKKFAEKVAIYLTLKFPKAPHSRPEPHLADTLSGFAIEMFEWYQTYSSKADYIAALAVIGFLNDLEFRWNVDRATKKRITKSDMAAAISASDSVTLSQLIRKHFAAIP